MQDLFAARRTIVSLYDARGISVDDAVRHETRDDVERMYVTDTASLCIVGTDKRSGAPFATLFHMNFKTPSLKLGVAYVRQYARIMEAAGLTQAILVMHAGFTPLAQQEAVRLRSGYGRDCGNVCMDPFLLRDLVVNVLQHDIVPEHVRIAHNAALGHRITTNVSLEQTTTRFEGISGNWARATSAEESMLRGGDIVNLPLLLDTDVVCRFLGFVPGDIVRVTRKDFVASRNVLLRRVVSAK
jgi:DNA-directed RNA polymerase subunit H (RpoH/RPB5)